MEKESTICLQIAKDTHSSQFSLQSMGIVFNSLSAE
jgi:hypothetical protein